MNIKGLKLRGFTGLKKGMGIDEITLDFSGMNGLIALAGPTGIGKSTIMENLHPFAKLVSRPNPSLKNHVLLRDSIKVLTFTHNGDFYRTVTKIDSHTGRTEGFIYLNDSDKSLNDGKITSYKGAMKELFGSTDLFFNSVFCAQNSEKMSSMDPAELKRLFVEFLGRRLEILVAQEDTAKQCVASLIDGVTALDRDKDRLERIIGTYVDLETQLSAGAQRKETLEKTISTLEGTIAINNESLSKLIDKQKQQVVDAKMVNEIESAREEIFEEVHRIKTVLGNDAAAIRAEMEEHETNLAACKETLKEKADIDAAQANKIKNTNDASMYEKDIDRLTIHLKQAAEDLEKEQTEYRSIQADLQKQTDAHMKFMGENNQAITELKAEINRKEDKIIGLREDSELKILRRDYEAAQESAADLEKCGTVTCDLELLGIPGRDSINFDCNTKDCEFVKKALAAKESLPDLGRAIHERIKKVNELMAQFEAGLLEDGKDLDEKNRAGKKADAEYLESSKEIERLKEETAEKGKSHAALKSSLEGELTAAQSNLKQCRELEKTFDDLASRVSEIRLAEARKTDLETYINTSMDRIKKITETAIVETRGKEAKIKQYDADIKTIEDRMDPKIDFTIEALKISIAGDEKEIDATRKDIEIVDADITKLKVFAKQKAEASDTLASVEERRTNLLKEHAEWGYIQTKCGANGLRALEINSVAPSIVHDGNKLLESALGAWAMIDIETLDEEGREVLRPVCIDQDGEKVLVANRSGGQQVWAMKAMRLAMTMVSKQKSGMDYKTAYADEDDAGLDIETAKNFTKLYRAFADQGEFEKVFFVSHKPQCVALADNVITLGEGGIIEAS